MVSAGVQSKELLCDGAKNFNPSLPTQWMYRVLSIFSFHPSSFSQSTVNLNTIRRVSSVCVLILLNHFVSLGSLDFSL